jgi:hypothetical protein
MKSHVEQTTVIERNDARLFDEVRKLGIQMYGKAG